MHNRSSVVVVSQVVLSAVMLSVAGCASSSTTSAGTPPSAAAPSVPLPAGRYPSAISKMVCGAKVKREVSEALGVTPMSVSAPTWVDHLYSCVYEFPTGPVTVSVQELSSWAQTLNSFHAMQRQFGRAASLANLGQGAFSENDGSVVVRKDWKILTVDVTHLPPHFGSPPVNPNNVAATVAAVILGCWSGD